MPEIVGESVLPHSSIDAVGWRLADELALEFSPSSDGAGSAGSLGEEVADTERRNTVAAFDQFTIPSAHDQPSGTATPILLAQATPPVSPQQPVGRVEKVSGNATIMRNGAQIELYVGNPVFKSDVIQTGSSGTVAVKFTDGTVFLLSASTRVAVNEIAYSVASTSNSVLFNLVQGTMALFAGRAAKTGDFAIDTPVATMGIRGTAVLIEVQEGTRATKFSLLRQPNGTEGSFVILDKANPGRVLAAITDARTSAIVQGFGAADVLTTFVAKTPQELRSEGAVVRSLFQIVGQQGQRRGSSDFDSDFVVPALHILDGPDPSDRIIVEPARFDSADRSEIIVPTLPRSGFLFQSSATEDGSIVSLDGLKGIAKAVIVQPPTLPPGVIFDARTATFRLDPSDPSFQHLGVGETAVVTVLYGISNGVEIVPARVSWTVSGRNDGPVAANDRVLDLPDAGAVRLPVQSNDRDIDGDVLRITNVTQPSEGSLRIDAAGNLIFDPGDEFAALGNGESATVSFSYTVADGNGLSDTATVLATVQGKGVFKAPTTVATNATLLPETGQTAAIALSGPARTTRESVELELSVVFGDVHQPMNIVYMIDVSASTDRHFAGLPVGDLNADGTPDTILDAEIANLAGLTERIRLLGFSPSDVTVTLIPFNGSADPTQGGAGFGPLSFNLGASGDQTIASALKSLTAAGQTNPERALQVAAETLQRLDPLGTEDNIVYVLSDGHQTGSVTATAGATESGFDNMMGLIGLPGSPILTERIGATARYDYDSDGAAGKYFALVNSDAAVQRVRYSAILDGGTQIEIYEGEPEGFTVADLLSKGAELETTSFLVGFEELADNDYDDFVATLELGQLPTLWLGLDDELAALASAGADIAAVGMGANANLTALQTIDNTLGADVVTSADGLDVSFVGVPIASGEVDRIVLSVNDRSVTYDEQDLVAVGDALKLKVRATDLGRLAGDTNEVEVAVTFSTGVTLSTSLTINGALPRSTDFDL